MGQNFRLGAKRLAQKLSKLGQLTVAVVMLSSITDAKREPPAESPWVKILDSKIQALEKIYPGKIGVHVKDLESGVDYSHRGSELWYIASGVKVPIALEVLKQVDEGKLSLDTKIKLEESDYIDGAGETNTNAPGTKLPVRYLVEQMLIHSDNTASDMLIRQVGLENVNACLKNAVADGFQPITSLSDVRRLAYSNFHPDAQKLRNQDIRAIRAVRDEKGRIEALARALKKKPRQLNCRTQDAAFATYYDSKMNSASLSSYTLLLEKIINGEFLKKDTQEFLLDTMLRVETGKKRIRAGFPEGFAFAHKTGTQHARVCDFGIAWDRSVTPHRRVVISACTRDIKSLVIAETALKSIGAAVYESDVFSDSTLR